MKKPENLIYLFFPLLIIYIASVGIIIPKLSIGTKIIGGFFFLYVLFLNLKYTKRSAFSFIYFYLFYLLILIFFSSGFEKSLKGFLNISISMLMFPISFKLINTFQKYKKLFISLFSLVIIYIINIIIANMFHLGGISYSEGSFEVGNIFTEGLNSMSYLIIALPMFLYLFPRNKKWIIIIIVFTFILVFVQLKRISIIAIAAGLLIFLVSYKNRKKALGGLIIVCVLFLFLFLFPFFKVTFQKQVEAREKNLVLENLKNEGRYMETPVVWEEIIRSDNFKIFLFGKELFNSGGNYGNGAFGDRQIHSDYNLLLHGSGVVGFIFYFFVQINIFYKGWRIIKKTKKIFNNDFIKLMYYLFFAFFIVGFIIMFSGGVDSPLFNSIRYVVLGSTLRLLYESYFKYTLKIDKKAFE